MTTCLITGATGFLGGHLVEACLGRGYRVRALARASSDTSLIEQAGAVVVRGDLAEAATLPAAVEEVDVVFHAAAKVGDWGPVEGYRIANVGGTRNLLVAGKGRAL
jgi:nucleoside-diphosphate-sugar epimerase